MSYLDSYPPVPTKDKSPVEMERKHAGGINYLLRESANIEDRLTDVETQVDRISVLMGSYNPTDEQVTNPAGTIPDPATLNAGEYYIVSPDSGVIDTVWPDITGLFAEVGDTIHVTTENKYLLVKQGSDFISSVVDDSAAGHITFEAGASSDVAATSNNHLVRKSQTDAIQLDIDTHEALTNNPHTVTHAQLTDVTIDQHHPQSHVHDGADGSGVVDHTDLTTIGTKTHAQLETDIDAIDAAFQAIRDVAVEKIYMNSPTTETGGDITGYTDVNTHVDCTATSDLVTGVITINTDGYYRVTAYISLAGTGNNSWYGLNLEVNGVATGLIGGMLWTNSWSGGAINGIFHGALVAGNTINLAWNPAGETIVPFDGQFGLEMVV